MPVTMEWESRLGRRLRVRDLYILTSVVKSGSMAKAARRLSMSQPAVSEAIANLEHLLGVRLLDRAPHGVTPTAYADAMLKRSIAIFDEMTESVRDVEFLADPATGRVTIGCPESVAATLLPLIAQRFGETYPRVVLQVEDVASPAISSSGLRERRIDLLFARWPTPDTKHMAVEELNVEQLFDDPVVVAAGAHARWAHRHRVRLEELAEEWWVMSPPGTWNYEWVARAFKDRGLGPPKLRIATYNAHLNTHFLKNGPFLTSYPRSWVKLGGFAVVPVDIPLQPMPLVNRGWPPTEDGPSLKGAPLASYGDCGCAAHLHRVSHVGVGLSAARLNGCHSARSTRKPATDSGSSWWMRSRASRSKAPIRAAATNTRRMPVNSRAITALTHFR